MPILQPARCSERALDDLILAELECHCRDSATFMRVVLKAKKMAPRLRGGPAVEWLPLQLLQQGAGERIPVAAFKLGHVAVVVKAF